MRKMTVKERLEDVSERSGLSEDIIRRVFNAERESIIDSLKRGEKATLIGRCTIEPELRQRLDVGGGLRKIVKLSARVSTSLSNELEDIEEFKDGEEEINMEGIMLMEIGSLS